MNLVLRYLIFLSWIVIGPSGGPMLWSLGVTVVGLVAAFVLRRSFRGRTIMLLAILGTMFTESLLFVLASSYVDSLGRTSTHFATSSWNLFSMLHTVNVGIALIGGFGAICTALFITFRKSRLEMSRLFPRLELLEDAPVQIKETVKRIAGLAGVLSPNVCLVDSGVPSAFTVRTNRRFTVALSVGLLESLDEKETEACIAHEISHLKNRDFTVRLLATLCKVALFIKPLSYFIEPAIYRAREFLADKTAAELLGGPDALISALSKLEASESLPATWPEGPTCVCSLRGGKSLLRILDKHPDLGTRIELLREMKQT